MTKPSTITQWLQRPGNITDKDRQVSASLLKSHPYFVPARLIEAAEQHKNSPFNSAMLNRMTLYMGNWLLFHEYLQTSAGVMTPVLETEEVEAVVSEDSHAAYMPHRGSETADYIEESHPEDEFEGIDEDDEDTTFDGSTDIDDDIWDSDYDEDEEIESQTTEEEEASSSETGAPTIEVAAEHEEETYEQEPVKAEAKEEIKAAPAAKEEPRKKEKPASTSHRQQNNDGLIQPLYTEDYFLHQGIPVSDKIPAEVDHIDDEKAKSLMVVMSFSEWLMHFKTKGEREKEEHQDQKALKTMWQKEKLAAALEEENEEIPENVFEMAVNSIAKEDDLVSESLAEIMVKQEKYDKAIDMYRKLSLKNPQKNAYFARKIDKIQKEKDS